MVLRGGSSKGAYFLEDDLPADPGTRDNVLQRIMGSPDARQIDGIGGAHPLTSKVAIVKKSTRPGVDVDYLFLQVFVDQAIVTDKQNCGNMLAAVGPFAIERGLVAGQNGETEVSIYMENTGQTAIATVQSPNGQPDYNGTARIDGVPGTAAGIPLLFTDTAGSSCGALLPTGNSVDIIDGIAVTLIDNGMPCVVLAASDLSITGQETRAELEANEALRARLEKIRMAAGPMMNLGDVTSASVPKMSMVSPATNGGTISTRTFIPHRCHASIGVLGAVSVATACLLPNSPASMVTSFTKGQHLSLSVEHPTGQMGVILNLDDTGAVTRAGILRTARKLFDGEAFID